MDYDEDQLARLETTENEIPVNVFADEETDFDLREGELCSVELMGIGSQLKIYENEKAFNDAQTGLAARSMIPAGTFPANDNVEDFEQSPHIIFTGKVIDVMIAPGYIIRGVAWLYGDIKRKMENDYEDHFERIQVKKIASRAL